MASETATLPSAALTCSAFGEAQAVLCRVAESDVALLGVIDMQASARFLPSPALTAGLQ
jgi:hypothetical protein